MRIQWLCNQFARILTINSLPIIPQEVVETARDQRVTPRLMMWTSACSQGGRKTPPLGSMKRLARATTAPLACRVSCHPEYTPASPMLWRGVVGIVLLGRGFCKGGTYPWEG